MTIFKEIVLVVIMLLAHEVLSQNEIKWIIKTSDSTKKEQTNDRTLQNDSLFSREIENLKEFYQEQGYFNPQFHNSISDSLIITKVDLNEKTNFLAFNYPKKDELDHIYYIYWINEKTGFIPFEKYTSLKNEITNKWNDNGYPFSRLILSNFHLTKDTLFVNMNLEKGNEKKIDRIIVAGYDAFPKKFIKNTFEIHENQLYRQSKINEISNKTAFIPFIKEIKKPEVFFTKDTTYLFLFFDKLENNEIDGIIGFSNAKKNKRIVLNGSFNLLLNNVLDKGAYIKIDWSADGETSQNFTNLIGIPYLGNSPISIENELEFYKKDTTNFNINEKISFIYKINNTHALGLNYSYLQSNVNEVVNSELQDFKSNFLGLKYQFKIPSTHPYFPYKIRIENEILSGERETLKQWKFNNNIEYVLTITKSSNFLITNQIGIMHSNSYLSNEVFKLGGINSIRGFKYKSIDATQYLLTKVNYIFSNTGQNFFEILSDTAYLKNQNKNIDLLYSLGLGYTTLIKNNYFSIKYFIGNQASLPITFNNSFLYLNFSQKF